MFYKCMIYALIAFIIITIAKDKLIPHGNGIDKIVENAATEAAKAAYIDEPTTFEEIFIGSFQNSTVNQTVDGLRYKDKFLYGINSNKIEINNILPLTSPKETIVTLFRKIREYQIEPKSDFETNAEFQNRYKESLNLLNQKDFMKDSYTCLGEASIKYDAEMKRWLLVNPFLSGDTNSFSKTFDSLTCFTESENRSYKTSRIEIDFINPIKSNKNILYMNDNYEFEIPMIANEAKKIIGIDYAITFKINSKTFPLESKFFSSIYTKDVLLAQALSIIFFDKHSGKIYLFKENTQATN